MKGKLSPADRKRLARLEREVKSLYEFAYKNDGNEGWEHEQRFNDRVSAKELEIQKLKNKNI